MYMYMLHVYIQVRGHVKDDSQVVESFIGQDSRDTSGFLMTSDPTWYLNPKVHRNSKVCLKITQMEGSIPINSSQTHPKNSKEISI